MTTRRLALSLCLGLGALCALGASPAAASPVWNLETHHNQTNFTPASAKASTLTEGSASTSEVQAIVVNAAAGKFHLSFGANTTPDLAFNSSASVAQSALRALPSIGSPNVTVKLTTEGNVRTYTVTFAGALANTNVAQILVASGTPALALTAQYWFDINNVGPSPSAGPVSLTVHLPAGLTSNRVLVGAEFQTLVKLTWSCLGESGASEVKCHTTEGSIPSHSLAHIILEVNVPAGLPEGAPLTTTATLEGGGAAAAVSDSEPTEISATPAGFGIVEPAFVPDFFAADGLTTEREAGAHPDLVSFPVDFNSVDTGRTTGEAKVPLKREAETVRDLSIDLPPGFIGNPTAVGECSQAAYTVGKCPPSSQVGRFDGSVTSPTTGAAWNFSTPIFNMVHPRGAVTDLGFQLLGNPVHVKASLDPANRYAITTKLADINETLPPFSGKGTIWGVPADSSHDSERCSSEFISTNEECSTDHEERPFISLPSQCEAENVFRLHRYDSWQDSGVFGPEVDYTIPGLITGCEKPRFEPEVEIEPTGKQANTPTGLDVHIKIAQNENPNALATPPVKRTTVTLPEGMSFSPAFADGLKACSLAQMRLGTNEAIECPDASRIGEVTLHTPLLPKAAEGSMYLAAQGDNPFGSLFALYLVLHDTEERGVLLKVPGKIEVDEASGKITTTFEDTPQFPFDDLTLKFRSGPRAPLVSPPSCGTQRIGVEIASYAQPNDPVNASNAYQVTEGPGGTPCPPDVAHRPFAPRLTAGTLNPSAGAYSPFVFRLAREDQEQELSRVSAALPPGLVAKIANLTPCPDSAIASISTQLGTGAAEQATPACPPTSEIGSLSAGLGAGPGPNYFPGKVYLAGPYKGAPLSLAVIAPGLAGPFDLGNVVVRTAINVDPATAQVSAASDPFPTALHGVILRVRDVRLRMDHPETTLNPTSCDPMSVTAQVFGSGGALFGAANPFQVGSCASLGFAPNLSLRLFGGTRRGAHPRLRATVTYPKGGAYANIAAASVALPHSEFLENAHIKTICTRVQFAAHQCPPDSVYGTATVKSPLFATPLEGPIYLRSSSNPLPDLVAVFKGPASQPVEIDLDGRIDSVKGGIRNSFEVVPDAPAEWATFNFEGGAKGLLVNSTDLCKSTNRATARFTAQNGRVLTLHPALTNSCKKRKGAGHGRAHRRQRH